MPDPIVSPAHGRESKLDKAVRLMMEGFPPVDQPCRALIWGIPCNREATVVMVVECGCEHRFCDECREDMEQDPRPGLCPKHLIPATPTWRKL